MDCFVALLLAVTGMGMSSRSRDMFCPSLASRSALSMNRGRREDRVHAAPAVSRAIVHKKVRTRAYRFGGGIPAFPARWFYGLYVLALVRLCFCATIIDDRLLAFRRLATSIGAAGPHDFTVRLCAQRQSHTERPPHLHPRSGRCATPLVSGEMALFLH